MASFTKPHNEKSKEVKSEMTLVAMGLSHPGQSIFQGYARQGLW